MVTFFFPTLAGSIGLPALANKLLLLIRNNVSARNFAGKVARKGGKSL